eukprot:scaffold6982_cov449-Prasinococcus_capsulatus_cf.AAC.5
MYLAVAWCCVLALNNPAVTAESMQTTRLQTLFNQVVHAPGNEATLDQALLSGAHGTNTEQGSGNVGFHESVTSQRAQSPSPMHSRATARRLLGLSTTASEDEHESYLRGNGEGMVLYSEGRTATGTSRVA